MERRGPRFRIVGALIPRLENREVCILGKALSVDPSGQRITLQCADGTEVRCNLSSPLQVSCSVLSHRPCQDFAGVVHSRGSRSRHTSS